MRTWEYDDGVGLDLEGAEFEAGGRDEQTGSRGTSGST